MLSSAFYSLPLSSEKDFAESKVATPPFLWKERNKRLFIEAARSNHARYAFLVLLLSYPGIYNVFLYFYIQAKIASVETWPRFNSQSDQSDHLLNISYPFVKQALMPAQRFISILTFCVKLD